MLSQPGVIRRHLILSRAFLLYLERTPQSICGRNNLTWSSTRGARSLANVETNRPASSLRYSFERRGKDSRSAAPVNYFRPKRSSWNTYNLHEIPFFLSKKRTRGPQLLPSSGVTAFQISLRDKVRHARPDIISISTRRVKNVGEAIKHAN